MAMAILVVTLRTTLWAKIGWEGTDSADSHRKGRIYVPVLKWEVGPLTGVLESHCLGRHACGWYAGALR